MRIKLRARHREQAQIDRVDARDRHARIKGQALHRAIPFGHGVSARIGSVALKVAKILCVLSVCLSRLHSIPTAFEGRLHRVDEA